MKEPVVRLGNPFARKVMRQVAIIASRHVMVAAFLPGVKMLLHHMTVSTRLRIVAEIAGTFSVTERKDTRTS